MKLLKIGTLNMPRNRWEDALDVFDDVDVFCFDTEVEIMNEYIHYIKFDTNKKLSFFLFRAARHFNYSRKKKLLSKICIILIRILNYKVISQLRNNNYDEIHSSYNDFDESAFLTMLLKPEHYTRAQKETRLHYSYFEESAFMNANRIVLNAPLNLHLFEKKYGKGFLAGKEILYDLDEDVRTRHLKDIIQYDEKLSNNDGKVHAVILAGRVLSDPNDPRSGGRLYYVNMIQDLLKVGIIVHLHTANIITHNGENPYERLETENDNFYIEEKLDFSGAPQDAYRILSRYDIGVCHAHLPNSEVTEFDKVNIPHRYYEYHLAHVVPFDLKGGNYLLENKARENHAKIYDDYNSITMESIYEIEWDLPTFSEYICKLYSEKTTKGNGLLYEKYRKLEEKEEKLYFEGRLGE